MPPVTWGDPVSTSVPIRDGTPARHVLTLWTSGELRFRVGDYVTLGIHGTYASSRVSEGSAYGTPPVDRARSHGGFGPNASAHVPLTDNARLGFAAAVVLGTVTPTVGACVAEVIDALHYTPCPGHPSMRYRPPIIFEHG